MSLNLASVKFCSHNLGFDGIILKKANLSHAFLSGNIFSGTDFSEANLEGADLSRADLRKVSFQFANLVSANLSKAILVKASLIQADLREADLSGADLRDAELEGSEWYASDVRKIFSQLKATKFIYIVVADRKKKKLYKNELFPGINSQYNSDNSFSWNSKLRQSLEEASIDLLDFMMMDDNEKIEALEDAGLDPFDFDIY